MTKLNELSIAVGEAALALGIAERVRDEAARSYEAAEMALDDFVESASQELPNAHTAPASEPEMGGVWAVRLPHEASHHINGGETRDPSYSSASESWPECTACEEASEDVGEGDEANRWAVAARIDGQVSAEISDDLRETLQDVLKAQPETDVIFDAAEEGGA